jgi:hypothetical protein
LFACAFFKGQLHSKRLFTLLDFVLILVLVMIHPKFYARYNLGESNIFSDSLKSTFTTGSTRGCSVQNSVFSSLAYNLFFFKTRIDPATPAMV